ncbi:unnamed protein product [Dibothriocephalus latus]|uniref:Uncharacterized protein n=1 Tax=Dibothriocephalus latus TaxID=60516 RepID=A0A3P7P5L7_DIBLA|nr:unnamed protein product [Dibothriocephalus latus]
MKTSAEIYEANQIAVAKAKRRIGSHKRLGSMTPTSNHLPHANQPRWTSSDTMQQHSDDSKFYKDEHSYSSPLSKTTSAITLNTEA